MLRRPIAALALVAALIAASPPMQAQDSPPPEVAVAATEAPGAPSPIAGLEMILMVIFSVIVSPMLTQALKRVSWVNEELGASINLLVCLILYTAGWALFGDSGGATPSDWQVWALWSFAAAGLSGAGYNLTHKAKGAARALGLIGLTMVGSLFLSGCTSAAAQACTSAAATGSERRQCLYADYANQIEASNAVYEETLRGVGRAARDGLISDDQVTQAEKVGLRAYAALQGAKTALAGAIRVDGAASPHAALLGAQAAVLELIQLARDLGLGESP